MTAASAEDGFTLLETVCVVAIVGMLAFGAGLDWIGMDRRRIRQADRDWFASHPAR